MHEYKCVHNCEYVRGVYVQVSVCLCIYVCVCELGDTQ